MSALSQTGLRLPAFVRRNLSAQPAFIFCLVLAAVGASQSAAFLSPFNVGNLVVQITPLLLVTIGQTYAVGSGGLDLSVGAIVSLVAVITAVLFAPLGIAAPSPWAFWPRSRSARSTGSSSPRASNRSWSRSRPFP